MSTNPKNDLVTNTLDLIHIISCALQDEKGETGHEDCNDCSYDCDSKAIAIVETIISKYKIVSK
jgi:hypothetical protein